MRTTERALVSIEKTESRARRFVELSHDLVDSLGAVGELTGVIGFYEVSV